MKNAIQSHFNYLDNTPESHSPKNLSQVSRLLWSILFRICLIRELFQPYLPHASNAQSVVHSTLNRNLMAHYYRTIHMLQLLMEFILSQQEKGSLLYSYILVVLHLSHSCFVNKNNYLNSTNFLTSFGWQVFICSRLEFNLFRLSQANHLCFFTYSIPFLSLYVVQQLSADSTYWHNCFV